MKKLLMTGVALMALCSVAQASDYGDAYAAAKNHALACQELMSSALNPIGNSPALGYYVKSPLEKNLLLDQAREICERYYAIDHPEARAAYDAAHGLHQCGATSWCAGK